MEILRIELTFRIKDFRDLYYTREMKNTFSGKRTQKYLRIVVLFSILSIFTYFLAIQHNEAAWVFLFVVFSVVAIGAVFFLLLGIKKYYTWKRGVETYLAHISKHPTQTLILTDRAIEIINPEKSVIDKWENIKKAIIEKAYISLKIDSEDQYFFPSGSMKSGEYEQLKEFIDYRMKTSPDIMVEETPVAQSQQHPDLSKLRKVLFWDTRMEKIDWLRQKRAVIERVFERGDEQEKNEITRFYGQETVDQILQEKNNPLSPGM